MAIGKSETRIRKAIKSLVPIGSGTVSVASMKASSWNRIVQRCYRVIASISGMDLGSRLSRANIPCFAGTSTTSSQTAIRSQRDAIGAGQHGPFNTRTNESEVVLTFVGGEGTGKGVWGHVMRRIFGEHGLHISSPSHLTGTFNGHLDRCLLLFADEALAEK